MVVGAGRGPLVRSAINAAANTQRKLKIYVIEKNPNAIITLTALIEELWSDKGRNKQKYLNYVFTKKKNSIL